MALINFIFQIASPQSYLFLIFYSLYLRCLGFYLCNLDLSCYNFFGFLTFHFFPALTSIPKLAIVITTYNSERFVNRALYSVLHQSEPFDEIIIVDHASTDNTISIINNFVLLHNNKTNFIRCDLKTNFGGPAWPRNLGIQQSKADYICFLDADDMCSYDRSSTIKRYLTFDPDILFHSFFNFFDLLHSPSIVKPFSLSNTSHVYENNLVNNDLLHDLFYKGMATCTGSFVVSRRIFRDHLFLEKRDVVGAEDAILLLDILLNQSIQAIYIGQPLLYYYIGSFRSTTDSRPIRSSLTSPYNSIRNVNYILDNYSSLSFNLTYRLLLSKHYSFFKSRSFLSLFVSILYMHPVQLLHYLCYVVRFTSRPFFSKSLLNSKFISFESLFIS